jgi:hypothetical protein
LRTRLAVAVLAIALIAAGCGDDDGGGGAPTSSAPASLTKVEWIQAADAICADIREQQATIEPPGSDPTLVTLTDAQLDAWAEYFESILPLGRESAERFDALGLPTDDADGAQEVVDLRVDAIERVEAAVEAGRGGDVLVFNAAVDDIVALQDEIASVNAEYGLEVCGQDDTSGDEPTPPTDATIPTSEWTDEVLAICSDRNAALNEIPEPSVALEEVTEDDLAEVAQYYGEVRTIYDSSLDDIAAIGLPEEAAQADAQAFLDAEADVVAALDDVIAAAESGDVDGFNDTFDALIDAASDSASIGQDLGVQECAE